MNAATIWGRLLIKGGYYYEFPKNYVKLEPKNAHFQVKLTFVALKQLKITKCGSYMRAAAIETDTTFSAATIQGRLLIKGGYN